MTLAPFLPMVRARPCHTQEASDQMRRQVFDVLASWIGVIIVVILLVAGGLLLWAAIFTHDQVHDQLAEQQIYFPPEAAFANPKEGTEITPSMIPSVSQYAGQQLLTGPQAQVYANDFIAVHLSEFPMGGVYSKLSTASRADPTNKVLQAAVDTSFKGTTLRGLLLQAYAFWTIGTIAFWAAIAAFVFAIVMGILAFFGFRHARRTGSDVDLMPKTASP
jgi:hypothetical protein